MGDRVCAGGDGVHGAGIVHQVPHGCARVGLLPDWCVVRDSVAPCVTDVLCVGGGGRRPSERNSGGRSRRRRCWRIAIANSNCVVPCPRARGRGYSYLPQRRSFTCTYTYFLRRTPSHARRYAATPSPRASPLGRSRAAVTTAPSARCRGGMTPPPPTDAAVVAVAPCTSEHTSAHKPPSPLSRRSLTPSSRVRQPMAGYAQETRPIAASADLT